MKIRADEVISVLYGPCGEVGRVALDPSRETVVEKTTVLVSLPRTLRELYRGKNLAPEKPRSTPGSPRPQEATTELIRAKTRTRKLDRRARALTQVKRIEAYSLILEERERERERRLVHELKGLHRLIAGESAAVDRLLYKAHCESQAGVRAANRRGWFEFVSSKYQNEPELGYVEALRRG